MNNNDMFWNSESSNTPEEMSFEETSVDIDLPLAKKKARKTFSVLGFGLAVYTLISLVAALIMQIIALVVSPALIEDVVFLNIISPLSLYVFALPVLLLVLFVFGGKGERPEKRRMGVGAWLLILLVSFGLMYIGSFSGQFVMWGVSEIVGYDYSNMLESMIDYDKMWVTAIFMCVVAPIGEEFVFRKLIIDRTHKYGGFVCIFFSGLVFGLMHANFYQFFYAFALGLVLGYVYYSTGKIWYTIALHATINFVGSIVVSYLDLGVTEMSEALEVLNTESTQEMLAFLGKFGFVIMAEYAFFALVMISMICAVVLPIVLRKKIKLENRESVLPRKAMTVAAFLNVGVIIMMLVYAVEFALNLIPPTIGQ